MKVLRAIVKGTVQGVGYRYFVQRRAAALGVSGWTRNLPDGNVEVEAEGAEEKLLSLLESLRQGPSMSDVAGVDTEWSETEKPHYSGFTIRY